MKSFADQVLASMVAKEPYSLPLAARYSASENGVPAALNMMSCWRIVTKINRVGQYIEDSELGTVFVTASVAIGDTESLFWARIKVVNSRITELEMFLCHSRGEGGFVHNPDQIGNLPQGWHEPVPSGHAASRAELEQLGRAVFDSTLSGPPAEEYSTLMEQGGVVYEDPDYLAMLTEGDMAEMAQGDHAQTMTGMGIFPFRPHSDYARLIAVDEAQGIVVVAATVWGYVSQHVMRSGQPQSAFVPDAMMENHLKTIVPEWMEGKPVINQMRAGCISTQMFRLHSGKIQGMQMLNYLVPVSGDAIWSGAPMPE